MNERAAPIVTICNDRPEWLSSREDGLGASDAPAYMGLSHWKTNVQLFKEKCGIVVPEDIGDKPYVKYGNDAEPL
ncbi:MAG: YqaJ viral recombinase family protein, partial [Oscillibacter sp.]|nr:YqaJ viral recombinase family protein [Oscillibacter sp.]